MKLKPFRRLLVALVLIGTLAAMFGMTLNVYAPAPQPLCAMKTMIDGNFYVPYVANPIGLNIDMIFTNPRLTGDQSGGVSPYTTIVNWPDGKIDLKDIVVIAKAFGSTPTAPNWNYMADVIADVNASTGMPSVAFTDLALTARDFGNTGLYTPYSALYPLVRVEFNNTGPFYSPNSSGFLSIPSIYQYPNYANFTVYYITARIGALVTFWGS